VLDVGCNRGLVGFEFANNGATLVHGCDKFVEGIDTAIQLFMDLRSVQAKHVVNNLALGSKEMKAFGDQRYDIVVVLATIHKLKRVMPAELLHGLVQDLGNRTIQYFAWRATTEKFQDNEDEMQMLDEQLGKCGLKRIHTSYISVELGLAAIWKRI